MKISAINEGVSLIANIGVIGSIIFLGLEMQQNTEMMQSQTRNSIAENQLSLYQTAIETPELFDIVHRLNSNLDVERTERGQMDWWAFSLLRMWENEFYQHELGLFESDEFEARTNFWKGVLGSDYNLEHWIRSQGSFDPDFRVYLNEIIDEIS